MVMQIKLIVIVVWTGGGCLQSDIVGEGGYIQSDMVWTRGGCLQSDMVGERGCIQSEMVWTGVVVSRVIWWGKRGLYTE